MSHPEAYLRIKACKTKEKAREAMGCEAPMETASRDAIYRGAIAHAESTVGTWRTDPFEFNTQYRKYIVCATYTYETWNSIDFVFYIRRVLSGLEPMVPQKAASLLIFAHHDMSLFYHALSHISPSEQASVRRYLIEERHQTRDMGRIIHDLTNHIQARRNLDLSSLHSFLVQHCHLRNAADLIGQFHSAHITPSKPLHVRRLVVGQQAARTRKRKRERENV
jgi:hypothetical protein